MIEALFIQVRGVVQGVGFRPFIYRLAKQNLISGWVLNAADGVTIHAEGEAKLLDSFVLAISEEAPAAAQVKEIEMKEVPLEDFDTFEIRFSDAAAVDTTTLISPDLATCDDCTRELFDESDPRYRYPFINCTNCGPRFTIIDGLPYDRKNTSMRDFPMCEHCQAEYDDPLDRRFHAQPNACFECGPHLSWSESSRADITTRRKEDVLAGSSRKTTASSANELSDAAGDAAGDLRKADGIGATETAKVLTASVPNGCSDSVADASSCDDLVEWGCSREESDAILARAIAFLRDGKIIAVKGLGGFHLVCDAGNEQALATLRDRKRRKGQAFAIMMPDMESVRDVCEVNPVEEQLLTGAQRPIVLLRKRRDAKFAQGLADGLTELGVMLPYTPVQHLLLHDFDAPLVMTSANIHDEPIVIDDAAARTALAGVADAFLGHDRAIEARYDDSVVRVIRLNGGSGSKADPEYSIQVIRRARGYAPMPLQLPGTLGDSAKCVFATGPEQKNTFCLTRGSEAFVSPHIGDMENAETFDAWLESKARYQRLFEITPTTVACDQHPEYLTSKWAHAQELPVVQVQHHHAHIVSVMAENEIEEAVAGIAFDGTGYGVDGAIWGGEVMLSNLLAFERFANFAYVPMPGGAAAIKHPLRMAYGVLWAFDLLEHPAAQDVLESLGPLAGVCEQMIDQGLNTPLTSSVGRLFDAASALLGICTEPRYEGEGAILLEAAMAGEDSATDSRVDDSGSTFDAILGMDSESVGTPDVSGGKEYDGGLDQELPEAYRIELIKNTATETSTAQDTSVLLFDAAPTFAALLDDKQAGVAPAVIAQRFHEAFVGAINDIAEAIRVMYGIETVALSGGVFMNRYLIERSIATLTQAGFTVAINRDLPPNDGSLSYGQAVVALALDNE